MLTRNLGIRYLWINSLCIIQDDRLDWEIECSKMADIYANCTLCISATALANSNGGCLFDRWTRYSSLPMAALKILGSASIVPQVFARPIPKAAHTAFFPGDIDDYSKSALLKRAWTFQERILSPRTIHFHEEEMVWECCMSTTCECEFLSWNKIDNSHQMNAWKAFFAGLFSHSVKARRPKNVWLEKIEEFSRLLITYETDRFPALAGLAGRLSEIVKSDYVAGCWKTTS
jgi:hypothetical protein